MDVPAEFARRIAESNGAAGVAWLNDLPAILAECEESWGLSLQPPFPLSYNYVAPATRRDGASVVLKVGMPNRELHREIEALRVFAGRGVVQLLDADPERGLLLLERIEPGTPLAELADDEAATAAAAGVMRELWRPVPQEHSFPTVADWAQGMRRLRARYDGRTGPLPPRLVAIAEERLSELLDSAAEPVVLHGDLHHWNILRSQRGRWLALDPKGVIGEPAYEVGALLRNPLPELLRSGSAKRTLARRIDQLAERLGFDRARLLGWGMAQAVLSAWWSIEDHGGGWEGAIEVAEILLELHSTDKTVR